tara:strand:+ start:348 stop:863 length:516 start_codon:yes stop_codon:yes gene_type:complete
MTVAERINDMHAACKGVYSLTTELVKWEGDIVVMCATLVIPERGTFTGHAYESSKTTQINKTSHLENCETSAIGRALAAAGYGGTEYATANEVQNAIHQQDTKSKAGATGNKEELTDQSKQAAFTRAVRELLAPESIINKLVKDYEVSTVDDIPADSRQKFFKELKAEVSK